MTDEGLRRSEPEGRAAPERPDAFATMSIRAEEQ
jgi:hypothetical protein